jgi:hypothetical protein
MKLNRQSEEDIRQFIGELRDEYLEAPTYYCWYEPCGLAEVGELAAKRVHRNWWDEYYSDIDYGGMHAKTYYDEIADYAIQVSADQFGVKSEHDRLLEEKDTWYDPCDKLSYRWDESLASNSAGSDEIDDCAYEVVDRLVEEFAVDGAPEFSAVVVDKEGEQQQLEPVTAG